MSALRRIAITALACLALGAVVAFAAEMVSGNAAAPALLGVGVAILLGGLSLVETIAGLRSGQVSSRFGLVERSTQPFLFWLTLAATGAGTALMAGLLAWCLFVLAGYA